MVRQIESCLKITISVIGIGFLLFIACQNQQDSSRTDSGTTVRRTEGITSAQASGHVGERTTVCGKVVGANYASGSKGSPTFLNFDKPYPNHPFVVVIWGSDRSNFPSSPEKHYLNKRLCATGLIETYKGKPQIIAREGHELSLNN